MSDTESIIREIQWNSSIEKLLIKWCDNAKCYAWMHEKASEYYDIRNTILIIVTSIIGFVGGGSNIIIGSVSTNSKIALIFGIISIFSGVISIIQNKLAYNSLSTKCCQFHSQWIFIKTNIEEELSISRKYRQKCSVFLSSMKKLINKSEAEGNYLIPEKIKMKCFNLFTSSNIDVPDTCGQMEHTIVCMEEDEQMFDRV